MPKANWQDPQDGETKSTDISGLQDAVGKMEDALNLGTTAETDVSLANVPAYNTSGVQEYRIYQASAGKRNWLASPAPTVKKNGSVITTGFSIDYGGGAILLDSSALNTDTFTASFSRTNSTPTIGAGNITQDATHRFATDTEKTTWNGKQDALGFSPENSANKGQANGYAGLGSDGKVPTTQLPSLTPASGSITDAMLSNDAGAIKAVVSNHLAEEAQYRLNLSRLNSMGGMA